MRPDSGWCCQKVRIAALYGLCKELQHESPTLGTNTSVPLYCVITDFGLSRIWNKGITDVDGAAVHSGAPPWR